MQRTALDRAERLIAISQFTRDGFVEANPRFKGRAIEICHPGIEAAPPAAAAGGQAPSALIVGRMSVDERYKGHDPLLEIWPDVAAAVPGAILRIVGEGDDRPRLERKAALLDLGPQIRFLGRVEEAVLGREYANCSAFVMPSRGEGFGFVFVEAMRAGRPCIGARGAADEIIVDGDTGWLVAAGDRTQLFEAVVRTLRNRAAAETMGERGRIRFLEQFTEDRFRDRFKALLPLPAPALIA
jgi:phosphatidylinositol alpha-1,6-mannosyltransferase